MASYPVAAISSAGKRASSTLVSCRPTMSGWLAASHATSRGRRMLSELTFQVASFTSCALASVRDPHQLVGKPGGDFRKDAKDDDRQEHAQHVRNRAPHDARDRHVRCDR